MQIIRIIYIGVLKPFQLFWRPQIRPFWNLSGWVGGCPSHAGIVSSYSIFCLCIFSCSSFHCIFIGYFTVFRCRFSVHDIRRILQCYFAIYINSDGVKTLVGRSVFGANRPWGETSLGRNAYGAKRLWGEMPMGRNVYGAKRPRG